MDAIQEVEKSYSRQEFVAELRRLADALEADETFTVPMYDEDVLVPEHAIPSIAYEIEDGFAEIEFQLTWAVAEEEDDEDSEDDADAEEKKEGEVAA